MRGGWIPRLQELSYLEVAALAIADGAKFDEVRKRLFRHMMELRANHPGSGNFANPYTTRLDPSKFIYNAVAALKELMNLHYLENAPLPWRLLQVSKYETTHFTMTQGGEEWVTLIKKDLRSAYDQLLSALWLAHPQLSGYMRVLSPSGIIIPLASWGELEGPRTQKRYDDYIDLLAKRVAQGTMDNSANWHASETDTRNAIVSYLNARDSGRKKRSSFKQLQVFLNGCEEAVVKFAFEVRGLSLDYISQQILRRWTGELGIANFSYHVPGVKALRSWPTADIKVEGGKVSANRRIGSELDNRVVEALGDAYQEVRTEQTFGSLWVPIYRVRASVCWKLRIPDAVFDRALEHFVRKETHFKVSYALNIDPAQHEQSPPTALPLQVQTSRGLQNFYSMSLSRRRERSTS